MEILENLTSVHIIQLMLAPAIMISACGLLLLGINNKYSIIVNRIRLLNEEKRKLLSGFDEKAPSANDNARLESITKQLEHFSIRIHLVRNCVLAYVFAVALFVLTSLLIGVSSFSSIERLDYIIIAAFLAGMVSVFTGALYAGKEIIKGYEIVIYEIDSHE